MTDKVTAHKSALAIIGPSGCGKSTIIRQLVAKHIITITPTWTDRAKRPHEKSIEHTFVNAKQLTRLINEQRFLEVVQPFGLPFRYGVPPLTAKQNTVPVLMIRAQFVPLFKRYYPNGIIYQIEASYDFAKKSLQDRSEEKPGSRLSNFEDERKSGRLLSDRFFINIPGKLEETIDEIIQALKQDFTYILGL